jgi:hypothetical protein
MTKLLKPPKHTVIERTALELAATWYEIGRGQGLTSKHKDARAYAAHNLEKFIPKAVEILLSMLGRTDLPDLMKAEIYEAFLERHNDPELQEVLPNIDVKKIIAAVDEMELNKTVVINSSKGGSVDNVLVNKTNPFMPKGN